MKLGRVLANAWGHNISGKAGTPAQPSGYSQLSLVRQAHCASRTNKPFMHLASPAPRQRGSWPHNMERWSSECTLDGLRRADSMALCLPKLGLPESLIFLNLPTAVFVRRSRARTTVLISMSYRGSLADHGKQCAFR